MDKSIKIIIALAALAVIGLVGVFWYNQKHKTVNLPYYKYTEATNTISASKDKGLRIGNFAFTNQLNQTFSQEDVKNKVAVADYFFVTCPGICKEMSGQLKRVYDQFKDHQNFVILSHTSKPEEDSVSVLKEYADRYGVEKHNKWQFLTGDKKKLYDVARNQYYIVNDEGDGDEDDFIHTERFVLLDQEGYIRGYYDGTDSVEVNKMMRDIELLVN